MIVICEECHKEFEKLRRLTGRHYCSRKCSNHGRARLGQKRLACVACKTFFVSTTGNQKCCSPKCFLDWGVIKTKLSYENAKAISRASATCLHCKRTFDYHHRPARGVRSFCGRSCASKHYIVTDVYRAWQVNGKRSKFEIEIEHELKKLFTNVRDTVKVNGWFIDLYVADIDLYVQADGVFWHGTDRSLDEIKKLKYEIDNDILKNYTRDREADF